MRAYYATRPVRWFAKAGRWLSALSDVSYLSDGELAGKGKANNESLRMPQVRGY